MLRILILSHCPYFIRRYNRDKSILKSTMFSLTQDLFPVKFQDGWRLSSYVNPVPVLFPLWPRSRQNQYIVQRKRKTDIVLKFAGSNTFFPFRQVSEIEFLWVFSIKCLNAVFFYLKYLHFLKLTVTHRSALAAAILHVPATRFLTAIEVDGLK